MTHNTNNSVSISVSDEESNENRIRARTRRKRKKPGHRTTSELPRYFLRLFLRYWIVLVFESTRIITKSAKLKKSPDSIPNKKNEGNLNRLDPTTKVISGVRQRCLKLLPPEELEHLDILERKDSSSPVKKLVYLTGTDSSSPVRVNGTTRFNLFTGNQTFAERENSFQVSETVSVHCGFFNENGGFRIKDEDKKFMQSCQVVVSTCAFGGGDNLYQPVGMSKASTQKVCYVAFWDDVTLATQEAEGHKIGENGYIGKWRIVVVKNLPFVDQRLNGKIPKMLSHRLFPEAKYSIWVDSKSQFRRDPLGVLDALLWRTNSVLAISEHGARSSVYDEAKAVVKKHKATPEEVEVQINQYRHDKLPEDKRFNGKKALCEASVIVMEHTPLTNLFMCLWFNEVVRYTSRDQLSFPYVFWRLKGLKKVNTFPVCTRKDLVNSMGHVRKAKPLVYLQGMNDAQKSGGGKSKSLTARRLVTRCFSSRPLHVCIVGSGPAGFYTADKAHEGARIDIIDRLPTPYGLVRSGVAPDHPETKIAINQFSRVAQHERCAFYGNVKLGSDLSLSELRDLYHVVVLAYGAETDKDLGIPGESLGGVFSAREFVWWYNGHPDYSSLKPDLKSSDKAVILGQGNVALDVARILLRPTTELASTDIATHALSALEESSIRKVYLVGRRGPVQAALTAKELREILGIKNLHIRIKETDLSVTPADEEEMKNSRARKRIYELLSKAAAAAGTFEGDCGQRELHFVFFRQPERFLESDESKGRVSGVNLEKTILESVGSGKQIAVGTGEFEDINCSMVLKAIGYQSVPINGLPFDHKKGIVPNVRGRVVSTEPGLYVCGWLKRGPVGIIATNLYCAEETVGSISQDIEEGGVGKSEKEGSKGLMQLLEKKEVKMVDFSGWEKIDAKEKQMGIDRNKPREKLVTWEDLLAAASADS
ncbi:hypothetical protein HID58_087288 [Brassica napus]|uniref:NADPH:adrenodoxin oxidoreductase, mitochondrial n=1 Tax=Brassica napus TaxID=3708 RepID=A0ABQ7XT01_BRANA|nr:hypothetical protein HID58_087288 [Brassica napus]